MKKTIGVILSIMILGGLVIFITNSNVEDSNYVVKIGYIPIMSSSLPIEIAVRKGFFEEENVEVSMIELQSSNLVSDALIRGDIDVTSGISIIPFLSAEISDPGKMKIFQLSDRDIDKPFDSILVNKDSVIKNISDLPGKKIGVFTGSTATNLLKIFFKNKGIDSSDMQFVQLAPTQHLQALSAGSIDALFTYEPTVSISLASEETRKLYGSVFAEILNHNPLNGAFVQTSFISRQPIEAEKITRALNRAIDFIRMEEDESKEIAKEVFKLSDEATEILFLPYSYHSSQMDKDLLQELINLLVYSGEIKTGPNITNSFYKP